MAEKLERLLFEDVTTRLTSDFPRHVERCLTVLTEDDIWWRPHDQSNAVGNLVLHVSGSNRYYFDHVIGGAPAVRDRDAEFAARGERTKAEVLRIWRDALARVVAVLGSLTDEHLTRPTSDRNRPVLEVLLHVTHHNALHIGQIVWITKMRRPGVIHELFRGAPAP